MAMAKGTKPKNIVFHHVFPNVLIPMITVIGGKLAAGFSGALIIEVIFNIPGMGRLMFESIYNADWNVVFGILLIISFITLITMLISDILYSYVNPKIDFES
jgi:peptide/nickel transport system permease protein